MKFNLLYMQMHADIMKRQRENSVENISRSTIGKQIWQEVCSEEKRFVFVAKGFVSSQISGRRKRAGDHTRRSESPRTHNARDDLPIVPLTVPNRMQPWNGVDASPGCSITREPGIGFKTDINHWDWFTASVLGFWQDLNSCYYS